MSVLHLSKVLEIFSWMHCICHFWLSSLLNVNARSAGSRYDSLGSTRAAKKKMHAGCSAGYVKKERLGNRAWNAYKSFRTMLLTGSWSHLVSRYAGLDLRSRTGGFFCFFNLGASSSSLTTSIGMFSTVLKRLFEYSNIFEQGFQNEYSNTKIENRIFEKVMNRAPSTMCKPSAAPLGAAAKAASR